MMGFGMMGGGIMGFLFIGLILYLLINPSNGSLLNNRHCDMKNDPIEILKIKFVQGEITEEEYNQRKKVLMS